mgnify:FL=1
MKTAAKFVVGVLISMLVGVMAFMAITFGMFCLMSNGFTTLKDGVPVSASELDWSSASIVSYTTYENLEFIDIKKYIGNDVSYCYMKDGRLHSITITGSIGNRFYNDITDPTQLAIYEPKAKALREQTIKRFSTVLPQR